MNALSKANMLEVTRLTRVGRLAEAMALLQGRSTAPSEVGSVPEPAAAGSPQITLDMVAPSALGGAWTAPPQSGYAAVGASGRPKPSRTMSAFRDRLPKAGSFSPLGRGVGGAPRAPIRVPEGARFEERMFSNEAGSRSYKVYVPSGCAGQTLPVVVMLHGCTQNPDDFAVGTRMNEVAEEKKFLVAYPHQPQSANMNKCWNWFKVEDQQRHGGEPSLIAGIALQVVEEFSADPTRVYAAGLSAGGAAAAIMAATYPDLFAAVGVHSGLACGAAKDMPSAFAAMSGGGTIQLRSGRTATPTIVFHGDADRTVSPVNGDQVAAQAATESTLTKVVNHGETPSGMKYTRAIQRDAAGRDVLEQWTLHGAGHAWSGGSADGSYTDPRGPDASREMIRFFLQHAKRSAN